MENEGWIKLHRKFLNWEWYTDTNTKVVFIHLLFLANLEDRRYRGIEIKRGDCIIGRHKLAYELNLSEREVRTAINHLISTNEITIKTTNKFTIVTICKFDSYQRTFQKSDQQTDQQDDQQPTSDRPTSDQQPTTPKEYKELNKGRMEEDSIAEKSATKKTLKERESEFYNELVQYVDKYGKDMIRAFYNYWSQKTKDGKKMLWEKQKAFEIPKRLVTWYHNEQKQLQQTNKGGEQLYRNNEERMEQAAREGWI